MWFNLTDLQCSEQTVTWDKLLDSKSPHKLMYSLQIVEALSRGSKHRRRSIVSVLKALNKRDCYNQLF